MTEWGNWVADGIAGCSRKRAEEEEREWAAKVGAWDATVDQHEQAGGVTRPVDAPARALRLREERSRGQQSFSSHRVVLADRPEMRSKTIVVLSCTCGQG
jgi:hypothetical protein